LTEPQVSEQTLSVAVTDLDAAPPAPAETAAVEAVQPSPPAQPEPPRRRSTVRERAPLVSGAEPAPPPAQPQSPAPQPVVTEVGEGENTERPRRSGWWSRRFAGG
jgi:ribonuclease E